jgi:hypothetical protein
MLYYVGNSHLLTLRLSGWAKRFYGAHFKMV